MHYWTDKDGSGNKLTDGRVCMVIKSDEIPDMPEIRVYGKDKDEVLEKAARTVETGQTQIHRLRSNPPAAQPRPSVPAPLTTDVAAAVADLSNPQKAPTAVKTLLKAGGFDVDAQTVRESAKKVADVCEAWENTHPEFPHDTRNQRMLIDRAIILAGGQYLKVTARELDKAFEELTQQEVFHEPKAAVQPEGTLDSRTTTPVRQATSYRSTKLRGSEPAAAPKESAKHAEWRNILEKGTGKALDDAIKTVPGFSEWVNQQYAKTA